MAFGFAVIILTKRKLGEPHLFSLHSWLGIVTGALFTIQVRYRQKSRVCKVPFCTCFIASVVSISWQLSYRCALVPCRSVHLFDPKYASFHTCAFDAVSSVRWPGDLRSLCCHMHIWLTGKDTTVYVSHDGKVRYTIRTCSKQHHSLSVCVDTVVRNTWSSVTKQLAPVTGAISTNHQKEWFSTAWALLYV